MKKTMSVRVHITLDDLENILYGAFQGTGYWAKDKNDKEGYSMGLANLDYESSMKKFLEGNLDIWFHDAEDEKKLYMLNIAKVKRGLTAMAKTEPKWFATILTEETDITTADALIQCAIFGKVIYS